MDNLSSSDKKEKKLETKTGRYVYDKKLGKVVKISNEIVGIKKSSSSGPDACPMNPGGRNCRDGCGF
ncbi:MAG: hypothetical protein HY796_04765 [Elusimicrobia bacterium]|nr:hypothetical protein [Elusimicrobiota bacterium]